MNETRNDTMRATGCSACQSRNGVSRAAAARENENTKAAKRRKGIIGRWLDRLAKTNEKEFGSGGPTCCG